MPRLRLVPVVALTLLFPSVSLAGPGPRVPGALPPGDGPGAWQGDGDDRDDGDEEAEAYGVDGDDGFDEGDDADDGGAPSPPPPRALDSRVDRDDRIEARGGVLSGLEAQILDETNLLRRDPRAYANKLIALRPSYRGKLIQRPGQTSILTQEGVAALDEAIAALRSAPQRLPRLAHADGLSRAARDHVRDLGRTGRLGHTGSDGGGPDTRAGRHGTWDGMVAENISFGPTSAEEIVIGLLVDDGVPDRGHREVLLTRELFFGGVACGPHPGYGTACVMTYATAFTSNKVRKSAEDEPVVSRPSAPSAPSNVTPPAVSQRPPYEGDVEGDDGSGCELADDHDEADDGRVDEGGADDGFTDPWSPRADPPRATTPPRYGPTPARPYYGPPRYYPGPRYYYGPPRYRPGPSYGPPYYQAPPPRPGRYY